MGGPLTTTTTLTVDEINLASLDFWARDDLHGALAKLRRERPVAWHEHPDCGRGFWSLTRYDDVAAVTRDWATFSSAFGTQVSYDLEDAGQLKFRSMISADPPRHTQLRSIVNRGFTPKVVSRAEASVRQRAREIVDAICVKGSADFAAEVAAVLPSAVICDLMGIPDADRANLLDLTNRFLGATDPEYGGTKESAQGARRELREYGLWLAKKRLDDPADDLTTTLVRADVAGDTLDAEELSSFFLLLLAAGTETTRNAIAHGLWALTQFPAEKQRWLADIDGHAATAAEEIVRWASPILHMRRTATRDTVIRDVEVRKGDKVALWYVSANRDEDCFADPFRFDVMRAPNDHAAFGTGGPHFCLGAHLARREIIAIFTELLRRVPDIEATAPPVRLRSNFLNGIKRLPVTFTPRAV